MQNIGAWDIYLQYGSQFDSKCKNSRNKMDKFCTSLVFLQGPLNFSHKISLIMEEGGIWFNYLLIFKLLFFKLDFVTYGVDVILLMMQTETAGVLLVAIASVFYISIFTAITHKFVTCYHKNTHTWWSQLYASNQSFAQCKWYINQKKKPFFKTIKPKSGVLDKQLHCPPKNTCRKCPCFNVLSFFFTYKVKTGAFDILSVYLNIIIIGNQIQFSSFSIKHNYIHHTWKC